MYTPSNNPEDTSGTNTPDGPLVQKESRSSSGNGTRSNGASAQPAALTSHRPNILNVAPSPLDLLRALQRRWLMALVLSLCLAIPVGLIAWFAIPITYTAESWLVARRKPLMFTDLQHTGTRLETHRDLISSTTVLSAALQTDGVADLDWVQERTLGGEDLIDWLKNDIQVTPPSTRGGSEIMKIYMTGEDRGQVEKLVQAVTEAYLDRVVAVEKKDLLESRNQLEKHYGHQMEEVRREREAVHEFAMELGAMTTKAVDAKSQMIMDHAMDLRKEILLARKEHRSLQRDLNSWVAAHNFQPDQPQSAPSDDLILSFLNNTSQDPESKWADWAIYNQRHRYTKSKLDNLVEIILEPDKDSEVIQLKKDLVEIKDQRDKIWNSYKTHILTLHKNNRLKSPLRLEFESVKSGVDESQLFFTEMKDDYESMSSNVKELNEYSAELERRQEEVKHKSTIASQLGYELEKLQVEINAGGWDQIKQMQKARAPGIGDGSKRNKMTGIAVLCGIVLTLGGTSLFEFHRRRITSSDDISEGLGIRVLGSVPMLDEHNWRVSDGEGNIEVQEAMDESSDSVRAMLLHAPNAASARTLLITSAKANEGKTTVASSLAASLGRSGYRTLLIDGDLRCPSVHRIFEMPIGTGFAEVLRNEATAKDVIRLSPVSNLWFMSAGLFDHASLQSLTKETTKEIFTQLKTEFDFIIVDSAPVLAVVDPLLLGQCCDGAILTVVRRESQVSAVYRTAERLESTGIAILGCVVNGLQKNLFWPGYYPYGYGYGYRRRSRDKEKTDETVTS
ncbi:MAG: polysaccharide biosynthesis tyrosine autokinase [Planctomycetales bacterium]